MKNSADLGGCYPPRPSASVDNTLLDLQNSSYPTQPHSIIAKCPYFCSEAKLKFSLSAPGESTVVLQQENLIKTFFPYHSVTVFLHSRTLLCLKFRLRTNHSTYKLARHDINLRHNTGLRIITPHSSVSPSVPYRIP